MFGPGRLKRTRCSHAMSLCLAGFAVSIGNHGIITRAWPAWRVAGVYPPTPLPVCGTPERPKAVCRSPFFKPPPNRRTELQPGQARTVPLTGNIWGEVCNYPSRCLDEIVPKGRRHATSDV